MLLLGMKWEGRRSEKGKRTFFFFFFNKFILFIFGCVGSSLLPLGFL